MNKRMFKNVELLMADQDESNMQAMLLDPTHKSLNVSLEHVIETDDQGRIVFFMPNAEVKWSLIFYIQNLMIRQRLHQMDEFIERQKGNDDN